MWELSPYSDGKRDLLHKIGWSWLNLKRGTMKFPYCISPQLCHRNAGQRKLLLPQLHLGSAFCAILPDMETVSINTVVNDLCVVHNTTDGYNGRDAVHYAKWRSILILQMSTCPIFSWFPIIFRLTFSTKISWIWFRKTFVLFHPRS